MVLDIDNNLYYIVLKEITTKNYKNIETIQK